MWLIISLIITGILLLVAELVLLPGVSLAGICALCAYSGAIYAAFTKYGTTGGVIVITIIIAVSIVATVISLRAKTWQKLSLKDSVDGTSQPLPENEVAVGDKGITVTRLAPSGNISINEKTYEAKSSGDIYVDPRTDVEVVGFENFTIIVKVVDKTGKDV